MTCRPAVDPPSLLTLRTPGRRREGINREGISGVSAGGPDDRRRGIDPPLAYHQLVFTSSGTSHSPMQAPVRRALAALSGSLFLSVAATPLALPAAAETVARAHGRCKLMNGDYEAFNGHCITKQKQNGGILAFVVELDDGSTYRFSGPNRQALNVETHEGVRNVQFRDENDRGVFIWNADGQRHRLAVKLDTAHNPAASYDDEKPTSVGTALGALAGAIIGGLLSGASSTSAAPARVGAPVPDLQSLVGARGGQAEATLTGKGYTYRTGKQMGDSAFSYWSQPGSGNCVVIRTTDGRYASITYAEKSECT